MDYLYTSKNDSAIGMFDITVEQKKSFRERILDKHEDDMRDLLHLYRSLVRKNELDTREIEQECQELINQDMAYAIQFLDVYDIRLDMKRLSAVMDDMVFLYGLSDLLERGLALVRNLVPIKGRIYSEIIRGYFFGNTGNTDEKVMDKIPGEISRRQYYREKKEAIRMMGYYFYEVVIPQIRRDGYKAPFTH